MWYQSKMKIRNFTMIAILALLVSRVEPLIACDLPPKELLQRSPGQYAEFQGKYTNEPYAYSVVIPRGSIGYDVADQPNHHGFALLVGDKSQGYIVVSGEANSLEYKTARDKLNDLLNYMRDEGRKVIASNISPSRLGQLRAYRLTVTYTCKESTERYKRVSIVALSPSRGWLYEVTLDSVSARYSSDQRVLGKLLQTWKYSGH